VGRSRPGKPRRMGDSRSLAVRRAASPCRGRRRHRPNAARRDGVAPPACGAWWSTSGIIQAGTSDSQGGLDSTLAVRMIVDQGIEVIAVKFTSPFFLTGRRLCRNELEPRWCQPRSPPCRSRRTYPAPSTPRQWALLCTGRNMSPNRIRQTWYNWHCARAESAST
jgi:hypothetical protein